MDANRWEMKIHTHRQGHQHRPCSDTVLQQGQRHRSLLCPNGHYHLTNVKDTPSGGEGERERVIHSPSPIVAGQATGVVPLSTRHTISYCMSSDGI